VLSPWHGKENVGGPQCERPGKRVTEPWAVGGTKEGGGSFHGKLNNRGGGGRNMGSKKRGRG